MPILTKRSRVCALLITGLLSPFACASTSWASTVNFGDSGWLVDFDNPKKKDTARTGFGYKVIDPKPFFMEEEEHENKGEEQESKEEEKEHRREHKHSREEASVVPLPAAFPLLLSGLAIIGMSARRRRRI